MNKTAIATLLLWLCVGSALAAEVFTTTGADGEKVYTDKPPADAGKVKLRYQRPATDPAKTAAQDPGKAFADMTPCEQARFKVSQYSSAEVLAERDENGDARELSAEETLAAIESARAEEKRLCEDQNDDDA